MKIENNKSQAVLLCVCFSAVFVLYLCSKNIMFSSVPAVNTGTIRVSQLLLNYLSDKQTLTSDMPPLCQPADCILFLENIIFPSIRPTLFCKNLYLILSAKIHLRCFLCMNCNISFQVYHVVSINNKSITCG